MKETTDRIGAVFAERYFIEAVLGKGGSGIVYLAVDQETGNRVALKVVFSEFFGSDQLRRRFMREAGIVKNIQHPNILATLRSGVSGDVFFHVMEFCKSGNLGDRLLELAVSEEAAVELMIQISRGVRALHQNKIVHRDIKAANILVGEDGNLKISDFGISQWQSTDLTKTRSVGTPTGMAPELWNGEDSTERSDIYALGVLFYELLTHERPFAGDTIGELAYAHLFTTPRPPSDFVACGEVLEHLIGRMLLRNKWDRIGTVDEVLDILEAIRSGQRPAIVTGKYSIEQDDFLDVEGRSYLKLAGVLIVTLLFVAVVVNLSFCDPLVDDKNNSDSFFDLRTPLTYQYKHYNRKSDGTGWDVTTTTDRFQVVHKNGSRFWQQIRKKDTAEILIAEFEFGEDGRSLYATHLSFMSESDPRTCISTECYGVDPVNYLWLPFIPGNMKYYKGLPQAVWNSSTGREAFKGYAAGSSTPIEGQLNPDTAHAWKFARFGREFRDHGGWLVYLHWPWFLTDRPHITSSGGYYQSLVPVPDIVWLVRRFLNCSEDVVAGDEQNWRSCKKFQDELYGKDVRGNPLGLILSVGGSIITSEEKDQKTEIPPEADVYGREFYAQNYLDVEYISTAVGEKLQ